MKKRYILLLMGFMLCGQELLAQQQYQLSQYFQHPHAINPSLSGIDDFWKVNLGYRQQYSGMEGIDSPETYFISFNGVFKKPDIRMNSVRISRPEAYEEQETDKAYSKRMRKHGFGGFLSQDRFAGYQITSGLLSYAYHIPLSRKLSMSVGFAGTVDNFGYTAQNYHVRTLIDDVYEAISAGRVNQTTYNLNVGSTLYGKNFYLGYAATQLILAETTSDDALDVPTTYINHYAMVGYQLNLSPQLMLQPSVMVRYDKLQEARFDANVKLRFDDLIWAGVSYRNKEAIAGMFGLVVNKDVTLGYAYEQNTGEFNIENNGTHEVVLGIRLSNKNRKMPYFW